MSAAPRITKYHKQPFVIRGYKGGCIFNFVSKIFRKRPKSPPPIRITSLEQYCKFFRERQAQGSALISGQEARARKIQERPSPKRPGSLPAVIAVRDAVNWQSVLQPKRRNIPPVHPLYPKRGKITKKAHQFLIWNLHNLPGAHEGERTLRFPLRSVPLLCQKLHKIQCYQKARRNRGMQENLTTSMS